MTLTILAVIIIMFAFFVIAIIHIYYTSLINKISDTRLQVLGNRRMIEDLLKSTTKLKRPLAIPSEKSHWKHYNGNEYEVMYITNEHSEHLDKYPLTVVYRGKNGRVWSRPLDKWFDSFTPIP